MEEKMNQKNVSIEELVETGFATVVGSAHLVYERVHDSDELNPSLLSKPVSFNNGLYFHGDKELVDAETYISFMKEKTAEKPRNHNFY